MIVHRVSCSRKEFGLRVLAADLRPDLGLRRVVVLWRAIRLDDNVTLFHMLSTYFIDRKMFMKVSTNRNKSFVWEPKS